jgi:hypothetical protein
MREVEDERGPLIAALAGIHGTEAGSSKLGELNSSELPY